MPQLNSRGFLYAPVRNTRTMCAMTATTIACAAQRWALRRNMPSVTANSRSLMSR